MCHDRLCKIINAVPPGGEGKQFVFQHNEPLSLKGRFSGH